MFSGIYATIILGEVQEVPREDSKCLEAVKRPHGVSSLLTAPVVSLSYLGWKGTGRDRSSVTSIHKEYLVAIASPWGKSNDMVGRQRPLLRHCLQVACQSQLHESPSASLMEKIIVSSVI